MGICFRSPGLLKCIYCRSSLTSIINSAPYVLTRYSNYNNAYKVLCSGASFVSLTIVRVSWRFLLYVSSPSLSSAPRASAVVSPWLLTSLVLYSLKYSSLGRHSCKAASLNVERSPSFKRIVSWMFIVGLNNVVLVYFVAQARILSTGISNYKRTLRYTHQDFNNNNF